MSETSVLAWGDLADEECAMFEMAAVREVRRISLTGQLWQ